jgi:hypothetical protein
MKKIVLAGCLLVLLAGCKNEIEYVRQPFNDPDLQEVISKYRELRSKIDEARDSEFYKLVDAYRDSGDRAARDVVLDKLWKYVVENLR